MGRTVGQPRRSDHDEEPLRLMITIHDAIRAWDTTQAQAASRLGVTQPRLNDLLQGKINPRWIPTLAGRAGLKVKINIGKAA